MMVMRKETELRILSAKSVAERLDCSLSQFYKEVKVGNFPPPDVKLWDESKRGFRWYEETVTHFIEKHLIARPDMDDEDAPPFVPLKVEDFLSNPRKKVA